MDDRNTLYRLNVLRYLEASTASVLTEAAGAVYERELRDGLERLAEEHRGRVRALDRLVREADGRGAEPPPELRRVVERRPRAVRDAEDDAAVAAALVQIESRNAEHYEDAIEDGLPPAVSRILGELLDGERRHVSYLESRVEVSVPAGPEAEAVRSGRFETPMRTPPTGRGEPVDGGGLTDAALGGGGDLTGGPSGSGATYTGVGRREREREEERKEEER